MDSCGSYIWENWDETWDSPTLKWTLCSQKTGYIWLSCAFLWILSPIEFRRASFLTSDWKRVPYTLYSMLRFFINLTLIALSGVWLVYALPFQSYDAWMNIWTPAMTLLSYSLALLLLKRNHDKGLESSGILFLFWLFTAIGAVSSYVYDVHELITNQEGWLTSSESYIYSTCVASLSVTEFILHCFSEHIPHKFIFGETVEPWPEYSAPFLSKITFNWVNSSFSHTILHHSKKDTIIEPPPGAKTEDLSQHFSIKYSANQNITACLRKMYWKSALSSAILRLVSVILLFANVVLFSQLLTCIINNDPKWHGFFYVGVMFVVQLVESLVRTQAQYKIETVAVKVRTSLNGAIYEKTLKLSCKSRTDYSPVAIANMVATDSMKIFNFMTTINCFWEIPVQIGIAVYLLWQTIGVACLSSIAVLAFFIPLTSTFESEYKIEAVRSRRAKDKRLKLLNEILAGFHVIKMYAWENSIVNHLLKHRNNEIARMKTQCFYLTGITWNVASGPLLVTLASLLTFSLLGNSLDPLNVFVTMVLLNIIRGPARLISKVISSTSEYRASAKRLETFLDAEEAKDDTVKRLSDDKFSVTVGRGYFSWRADVDMTLEDINLRIRKGSFVAVIGGELSGKSSLLSALLGDMYVNRGVVNIDGTIAYLPRRPWVRKASIKENILFTSAYDEERYKTVIDACFLREVLDNCSEGDETEVTEEFSASANCRINLARALYSNRSVYLLNDPLDCVDEIVAKNIYDNVFGPEGMLQEKTRILVTRQMSILPKTDLIVMLKEGKIVAQGQFQELLKSNNEFFMESIGEYLDLSNSDAGEFEEEIRQAFGRPLAESSSSSLKFSKAAEIAKHTKAWTRVSTKAQVTDSSRGPKLSIYSAYISLLGFSYLAVILITYSIGCGMNIWTLTWLSDWSSEASNGGQLAYSVSQRQLDYALLALGTVLALLASSWIVYSATVHASDLLHSKMVNQVLGTSNSFFAKQPAGNTSNQFDRTLDAVDTSLRVNLKQSSDFFLRLILSIAVISLVMPVFLVALLPLLMKYYSVQSKYSNTSRHTRDLNVQARVKFRSHFRETAFGITTIKAFDCLDMFKREFAIHADRRNCTALLDAAARFWLQLRLDFIANQLFLCVSLLSLILYASEKTGLLALAIGLTLMFSGTLNVFSRSIADMDSFFLAFERCWKVCQWPLETDDQAVETDTWWPDQGCIKFDNFSCTGSPALSDISFKVEPREKLAIVGDPGNGKTSLALSLLRMTNVTGGSISIDDIDISKVSLKRLRSRISLVPQEPVLFTGSVRYNVDPCGFYTDEEIWTALRIAHLDGYVSNTDGALQHNIASFGANLTLSQRQLLCLARALVRRSRILILDEATTAVDQTVDDLVEEGIRKEFPESTLILVAHRLKTVLSADRMIVLDNGEVVDQDSPNALLVNTDSVFYNCKRSWSDSHLWKRTSVILEEGESDAS